MITYYTFVDKLRGALRSLTIWVTSLFAALTPALDYAQTQIPQLAAILPANLYQWSFGSLVVASILLRFHTKTALEYKTASSLDYKP